MKKQTFLLLGILFLSSVLVGCHVEMTKSEWANKYGFEEGEVFDIEIGNYGFPYINTEINGLQIKMMYDTGNMIGISVTKEIAMQSGLNKVDEIVRIDTGGLFIGKFDVFEDAIVKVFGREITGKGSMNFLVKILMASYRLPYFWIIGLQLITRINIWEFPKTNFLRILNKQTSL